MHCISPFISSLQIDKNDFMICIRLSLGEMTSENVQMELAHNFGGIEFNAEFCEKYFGDFLKTLNNNNPWFYKPIPTEQLFDSNLNNSDDIPKPHMRNIDYQKN